MRAFEGQKRAVTCADIEEASRILEGEAHPTPLLTSRTVDALTGAQVFFKCENLQRAGAFKVCGALSSTVQPPRRVPERFN